MDMESFALEAESKGAVVMLALHGGLQANGAVQRFLEEMDIPFTGPSWQSAYLCGNQVCPPPLPTRAVNVHTNGAVTGLGGSCTYHMAAETRHKLPVIHDSYPTLPVLRPEGIWVSCNRHIGEKSVVCWGAGDDGRSAG